MKIQQLSFKTFTLSIIGMTYSMNCKSSDSIKPNFVWFMTEDVSSDYLALYNQGLVGAKTPNVERLAKEGIVFNNAYSNAPVSSAARTSLFTACYAPRIGGAYHRKLKKVGLPEGLNMFPSYLRKAGYHTSNANKTDYNCFTDPTAWDEINGKVGEWRKRKDKSQPFFYVRTNFDTHESRIHFKKEEMRDVQNDVSIEDVKLHPNVKDTELMRYTYAKFYSNIMKSDQELGLIIDMLKEDNLLDNTFIFYMGDNGGSLPGTKGYTCDLGLHVPLVVYIPEKWRDKLPVDINVRTDGFVSFIDLGPTLLELAGIKIPEQMDGTPILGTDISINDINKRDIVWGYGDRYDELYAFTRTLRKGNLKYTRNFQPYHTKSLFAEYRYIQAAFAEWKELYLDNQLNEVQSAFFEPQGAEELYDLSIDPYETKNLIGNKDYSDDLIALRKMLRDNIVKMNDLSMIPEPELLIRADLKNPAAYGEKHSGDIEKYLDIVQLQMVPFSKAKKQIVKSLQSEDPIEKYWALTVCASNNKGSKELVKYIEPLINDNNVLVSSRAVVCLTQNGYRNANNDMKKLLERAPSGPHSLMILNDAAYLFEQYDIKFDINKSNIPEKCTGVQNRIKYLLGI